MDFVQYFVLSAQGNKSRGGNVQTWVNKQAALLDRELEKLEGLF